MDAPLSPQQWDLVVANAAYGKAVARPFLAQRPDLDDRIADAVLDGLCAAAAGYDPRRGCFTTYAKPHVRGRILTLLAQDGRHELRHRFVLARRTPSACRRHNGRAMPPARLPASPMEGRELLEALVALAPAIARPLLLMEHLRGASRAEMAARLGWIREHVSYRYRAALVELADTVAQRATLLGVDLPATAGR
jgi:hypothetical protein